MSVLPSLSAPVGAIAIPITGLKTSGWFKSIGARVPTPPSVGANWLSLRISMPVLSS